jgi:hypothetical protein
MIIQGFTPPWRLAYKTPMGAAMPDAASWSGTRTEESISLGELGAAAAVVSIASGVNSLFQAIATSQQSNAMAQNLFDYHVANYRPLEQSDITEEQYEQYIQAVRAERMVEKALALRDLKLKALKDNIPVSLCDVRSYVASYTNRHSCLSLIIGLRPFMTTPDWYTVLGENWGTFFSVGPYIDELRAALPATGPVLEMMTENERAKYSALPNSVAIYRGCGSDERPGICWSLQRETANKFRSFAGYRPLGSPVLLAATVNKSKILAVKLDRAEDEVVTFAAETILATPR